MISRINFNQRFKLTSPIEPSIKAQLDALNLQPTGSKEGDLAAIKGALDEQGINTDKADKASSLMGVQSDKDKPIPPWASLMEELNVRPTGTKEGDFAAISTKLSTMSSQATTEAEQTKATSLTSQFNALGGSLNMQPNKTDSSQPPVEKSIDYTGQNQIAELNRWFLVKRKES